MMIKSKVFHHLVLIKQKKFCIFCKLTHAVELDEKIFAIDLANICNNYQKKFKISFFIFEY